MPQDGLTLGFLARELNAVLQGGRIDKLNQPYADMLVMTVRSNGQNYRLLINASPTYTRMHLTDQRYENPKQAPVFLMLCRKHLQGARIVGIRQLFHDRLAVIDLLGYDELGVEGQKQLYFEATGRHTNLSLVADGVIVDAIRHVGHDMSRVRVMLPGQPYRMPPMQDKLPADALDETALAARLQGETGRLDKALMEHIAGLSLQTAKELAFALAARPAPLMGEAGDVVVLARRAKETLTEWMAQPRPLLILDGEGHPLDALPFPYRTLQGEGAQPMDSLSLAMDELFSKRDLLNRQSQRQQAARRSLQNALKRAENKMLAQEEEMKNAERMEDFRVAGELLTAFGAQVEKGAGEASLPNYYNDNEPLAIALDVGLTAAQNAQRYFKKYKKANIARRVAKEQWEAAQREKLLLEDALFFLERAASEQEIDEVLSPLTEQGILKRARGRDKQKPVKTGQGERFAASDGLMISVGRSQKQNEALLKAANGLDVWLHAKDMPGSHVIIHTDGQTASDATVLEAAKLAAFYSKGRGVRVPVDVVLRKYVKKPANTAPGFVIFTDNRTLVVDATEQEILGMKKA